AEGVANGRAAPAVELALWYLALLRQIAAQQPLAFSVQPEAAALLATCLRHAAPAAGELEEGAATFGIVAEAAGALELLGGERPAIGELWRAADRAAHALHLQEGHLPLAQAPAAFILQQLRRGDSATPRPAHVAVAAGPIVVPGRAAVV